MPTDSESTSREPAFDDEELLELREQLLDWYGRHRRELPWRGVDDPYATWVAEVMLQQTQVATVVDYYRRWMEQFPDVERLAEAERDEVMDLWEGLGYYRRARFLHRSARKVVDEYGGELPGEAEELEELPGIGPYTAGAIASIAFDRAEPVVDGNVSRVLSRLRAIPGDPTSTENEKAYWRLAEQLVDSEAPGDFNQAMMELGATVCTPTSPACLICPVSDHCEAFREGAPEAYPDTASRANKKPVTLATTVPVRSGRGGDEVWVSRRPPDGLLGGLWEFPTVEVDDDRAPRAAAAEYLRDEDVADEVAEHWIRADEFVHHFSHRRLTVHPLAGRVDGATGTAFDPEAGEGWIEVTRLDELGMSAVMRRVERAIREADGVDVLDP